jgi:DNA processing protein
VAEGEELHYWVALHGLPEMGPITFRRLLDRFGSVRAVFELGTSEILGAIRGVSSDMARTILDGNAALDQARHMTDRLRGCGVRIVRMTDQDYPAPLHDLADPPPLLYMVGEVTPDDLRAVGMIGTTKPSGKGRAIAEQFAARLVAEGVTVVSGYAHGVDAASHRGAFNGGGRSLLCVPYGMRHFKSRPDFPPLSEISRRGALISECPPDQEWSSRTAVARNRLIAALSRALFIIEVRPRGGTMHTVRAAEGLGRPVFALKYRTPPESARGNAILLGRGATPVAMFNEIDKILKKVG